jgi:hypothetical protein
MRIQQIQHSLVYLRKESKLIHFMTIRLLIKLIIMLEVSVEIYLIFNNTKIQNKFMEKMVNH